MSLARLLSVTNRCSDYSYKQKLFPHLKSFFLANCFQGRQSFCEKASIEQLETGLEVQFGSHGKLSLDNLWLRIHCRCPQCFLKKSYQRNLSFLEISEDVLPQHAHFNNYGELIINWSDNHKSTYQMDWIVKMLKNNPKPIPQFWAKTFWSNRTHPIVNFDQNLTNDQFSKQVLTNLLTYGFCIVSKINPSLEAIRYVVEKIFPVQNTFWGSMWTVQTGTKSSLDSAFSTDALPPHNDQTYYTEASGLQIFSCMQQPTSGGETILVDGFYAAECLQKENPQSYTCLTTVPIESTYEDDDGNYHTHSDYVIRQCHSSGDLNQIRFNPLDIGCFRNLRGTDLRKFYSSYKDLAQIIFNPANQLVLNWSPGWVLFIDNWRVLHGRNSFTGNRVLGGCNVSRCDYISQVKRLSLM